jgi:hypothetical protein
MIRNTTYHGSWDGIATPIILLFMALFTSSCLDDTMDFNDIEKSDWNAEWAIPLINSEFSIQEVLNQDEGVIRIDEGGFISLVYHSDQLLSVKAEEQIEVPDQDMNSQEPFILAEIPPGISDSIVIPFNFTFETDSSNHRADSSYFKSGNFRNLLETNLNKDIANCIVRYPSIREKESRNMLIQDFDLNYTGDVISRESFTTLNDYIFIYNSEGGDDNMLGAEVVIYYTSDGNPILPDYYFKINTLITEITYSNLYGYLGQYNYTLEDTIFFDVFSRNTSGSISINPEAIDFTINTFNSYGMPIELNILEFFGKHSGPTPVTKDIYLYGEGIPAIIDLNYPDYSQIGEYALTQINTNQSNIADVLEISPDEIHIVIEGKSNPDNDSTLLNFVLDTSSFHMDIKLELGLHGSINHFSIEDTFDLYLNTEVLDQATFLISTVNRFPIDADIQIYYVDSLYTVLDSLIKKEEQMVFKGAEVGPLPDLRILDPVNPYAVTIPLNEAGLRKIDDATQMILRASLQTSQGQQVKIYDDYSIGIRLGVIAGVPY